MIKYNEVGKGSVLCWESDTVMIMKLYIKGVAGLTIQYHVRSVGRKEKRVEEVEILVPIMSQ